MKAAGVAVTRRRFGFFSGAFLTGAARPGERDDAISFDRFVAAWAGRGGVGPVLLAEVSPSEADGAARHALRLDGGRPLPAAGWHEAADRASADDFRAGRVVTVRGWVLSKTEVGLGILGTRGRPL